MKRSLVTFLVSALTIPTLLGGCAAGGTGSTGEGQIPDAGQVDRVRPDRADERMIPAGYGTLSQDQITLDLRVGDLLLKVTPLEEWIIRLTAPDTYQRLSALKAQYGEALRTQAADPDAELFLVSFFSYAQNTRYEQEAVNLVNFGIRSRPRAIRGITPGWGTQRLGQQQTHLGLYAFSGPIDYSQELVVEYQNARNDSWNRLYTLLDSERAKARARAPSGEGTGR